MKRTLLSIALLAIGIAVSAITLNGVNYTIDTLQQFSAGPGAMYYQLRMLRSSDRAGRLDCYLMTVDTRNPYVSIEQVLGQDKVIGTERPSAMAVRKTTDTRIFYGGTNGDFFVTQGDVGRPTGLTIVNSEFAYIPASSTRRLGAVDEQMKGAIASQMSFSGQATVAGEALSISHVNYTRADNQLVLYNRHNAPTTLTNSYGTELVLSLLPGSEWHTCTTVQAVVTDRQVGIGNAAIPAGQAVLSGHGTMATALNAAAVGDTVTITLSLTMDGAPANISQCIGGDNYALILDNGQPVSTSNFWDEKHPRTAFGQSSTGDVLYFLVVDGRGVSEGCNTKILGEILCHYGAWRGVNWDGGGSSCLYIRPFGEVNRGSDGTERAVGNAMFAVANVPAADNTIASIAPYQPVYSLPRYGIAAPRFLGYNQYGVLISTDVEGVTLSCDDAVGEILADGRFLASGANGGTLTATLADDITADIEVRLISSAPIAIRLDSVLRDSRHPYEVEVVGTVGNATISLLASALSWRSLDETVATVDAEGRVLGVSNGYAEIVGTLGDFSDTLLAHVEIPASHLEYWQPYANPDWWTLTSTSGYNPSLFQPACEPCPDDGTPCLCPSLLEFSYSLGRQPFVMMALDRPIYSLPDTIRIPFSSTAELAKVLVGIRTNDATSSRTLTFYPTGVAANANAVMDIPVAATFGDDAAIFPLWLDYIKFVISTSTSEGLHTILLPEISLIYSAYDAPSALPAVTAEPHTPTTLIREGSSLYLMHGDRRYTLTGQRVR